MKTDILQKELTNLIHLTKRWEEQSYIPKIEKDIALKRVQNIYAALLGIEVEEESDIAPQISNFNAAAPIQSSEPNEQQEVEDANQVENAAEAVEATQEEESEIEVEIEAKPNEEVAVEEVEITQSEEEETPETEEEEEIAEPVIEEQVQEEQPQEVPQEEEEEQQPQEQEPTAMADNSITIIEQMMNEAQKMRFTHDLFCNDYTIFKNEIRKINKLDTLDEVLIYIEEYYRWSSENQSALEFVELVASKFQNN